MGSRADDGRTAELNSEESHTLNASDGSLEQVFRDGMKLVRGMDRTRPLVMMLGNTGEGKSTLINALLGHKLEKAKGRGMGLGSNKPLRLVDTKLGDNVRGPKIGESLVVSQTILPSLYQDDSCGCTWVDTAGFRDSRGAEYRAFASGFTQYVISKAERLKGFIVCVSIPSMRTQRADALRKLMSSIHTFCPDPKRLNIAFVITKAGHISVEEVRAFLSVMRQEVEQEKSLDVEVKTEQTAVIDLMLSSPLFCFDMEPPSLKTLVRGWKTQEKRFLNEVADGTIKEWMQRDAFAKLDPLISSAREAQNGLRERTLLLDEQEYHAKSKQRVQEGLRAAESDASLGEWEEAARTLSQALQDGRRRLDEKRAEIGKLEQDMDVLRRERREYESVQEVRHWSDSVCRDMAFISSVVSHTFTYTGVPIVRHEVDLDQDKMEIVSRNLDKSTGRLRVTVCNKKKWHGCRAHKLRAGVVVFCRFCDTPSAVAAKKNIDAGVRCLEVLKGASENDEKSLVREMQRQEADLKECENSKELGETTRRVLLGALRSTLRNSEEAHVIVTQRINEVTATLRGLIPHLSMDEVSKFRLEMLDVLNIRSDVLESLPERVAKVTSEIRHLK